MQINTLKEKANFRNLGWMPRTTRGLGIDIGQMVTKIVSVERHRSSIQSACAVSIPTRAESAIVDNPQCSWSTRELKALSRVVKQILGGRADFRRSRVAVTLSMSACDYRTVYVPQNTRVNMRDVQETISLAKNDKRTRCIALLPNPLADSNEPQDKLRCFSLPEDLSWSVAQTLDDVGLTPNALNGAPWCLTNALQLVANSADPTTIDLALDWSFGSPTLVAVKSGQISYVRSMVHGSVQELIATASVDYQMDAVEAVHWIARSLEQTALNVADAAQIETYDAVSRICSQLAEEIHTALEYVAWRHQGCNVGTLWLMGGAPRIAGLSDLLKAKLSCPVAEWRVTVGDACLTSEFALAAALAWGEV